MEHNVVDRLLGSLVILALLATLGLLIPTRRAAFWAGLAAIGIAHSIALLTGAVLNAGFPRGLPSFLLPFIDPLIEESVRLVFICGLVKALFRETTIIAASVAFAFGYASFEAVTRLLDVMLQLEGHYGFDLTLLGVISVPMVVLLVQLMLSFVSIALVLRGWPTWQVWCIALALHAAHNATVLWIPGPASLEQALLGNGARAAILMILVVLGFRSIIRQGRKFSERSEVSTT